MTSIDSFGARGTLDVGSASYEIFRIAAVEGSARLPFTHKVLLENLLRTEDGANVTHDTIASLGAWDPSAEPSQEIQFTPGPRRHAGLHRRAGRRRPRHDARGRQGARGRPVADRAAGPRRARDRPLRHRRLLRHPRGAEPERRARVRAQPRALPVPALGPERVRGVQGRSPGPGHRPSGQHRGTRARRHGPRRPGLPRHGRRHGLAHDHGQRTRRARLGRRRDRGRGGHARPAGVDADSARRGLQADRRAAGRRDRHRPRPHHHRDAAQARRGRQVRGVLRRRRRRGAAREPRDHRQHVARVRLDGGDLPDRRGDDRLPAAHRALGRADRAGGGLREGAGPLARRGPRARLLGVHRARRVHGRAVARRPEASAGPRAPVGVEGRVRGLARRLHVGAGRGRRDDDRRIPGRDRAWCRRHRRHHLVHQHVQPLRHDRRRPAGQEGGREGPLAQAVGQDHARAGIEGRDGLLRQGRPDPVPGQAGLQRRRLRLHDLHRQLRPAHPGGQRSGQRRRPGRRVRPVGQPQLRGSDQPRREDELPRVPAAGGRIRAGGHDGHRPRHGAAGLRRRGQRRVPRRRVADGAGDPGGHRLLDHCGDVRDAQRRRVHRRPSLAGPQDPERRHLRVGAPAAPTSASPRTSTA